MTLGQIVQPNGKAAGTFLKDAMALPEGRLTLIYLLVKLGLFEKTETEAQAAVRAAALDILKDINAQTGFALDINLIH